MRQETRFNPSSCIALGSQTPTHRPRWSSLAATPSGIWCVHRCFAWLRFPAHHPGQKTVSWRESAAARQPRLRSRAGRLAQRVVFCLAPSSCGVTHPTFPGIENASSCKAWGGSSRPEEPSPPPATRPHHPDTESAHPAGKGPGARGGREGRWQRRERAVTSRRSCGRPLRSCTLARPARGVRFPRR